jgi:O-antigen ligase
LTDGVIAQRYGISSVSYGERLVLDLTGRMDIYRIDFEIFKDNFFTGIGPGQGNEAREQYGYGKRVAAHVEYSRMLAEHGILGLISLILLISLPFSSFYNCKKTRGRFIIILFASLAMLTMTHSAMRLAIPSFIFGLIFPKYDI